MRYFGIYTDMPDSDIETALSTLGELVNLGSLDFTTSMNDDISERQLEVAWKVHALWGEEQNQ